jgi:hypothetical protein
MLQTEPMKMGWVGTEEGLEEPAVPEERHLGQ